MPVRPLITLYAPMAAIVAAETLKAQEDLMHKFGFRTWITCDGPHMTLMVDSPQVWCERGPTQREMDWFWQLYNAERIEEAQAFAQRGHPRELR